MNWSLKRRNGNGSASNGHIIEMAGITKVYDTGKIKVEALRGIDLRVGKGEFVAVVGPSGSGKSTLLNLSAAWTRPLTGSIASAARPSPGSTAISSPTSAIAGSASCSRTSTCCRS